jgi:four helix bundle protein
MEMKAKSYRDLEIYRLSFDHAMKLHSVSLKLPQYELYEEGSQLRKSSKGICSYIVEGYGRRNYKGDFIRFLTYAQASCDETEVHLDFIHASGYISDKLYLELKEENDKLGKKINKFIQYVQRYWKGGNDK